MSIRLLFALAVMLCLYAIVAMAPSVGVSSSSAIALSGPATLAIDGGTVGLVGTTLSQPELSSEVSISAVNEPVSIVALKLLTALGMVALLMFKLAASLKPVASREQDK